MGHFTVTISRKALNLDQNHVFFINAFLAKTGLIPTKIATFSGPPFFTSWYASHRALNFLSHEYCQVWATLLLTISRKALNLDQNHVFFINAFLAKTGLILTKIATFSGPPFFTSWYASHRALNFLSHEYCQVWAILLLTISRKALNLDQNHVFFINAFLAKTGLILTKIATFSGPPFFIS